MYRGRIDGIVYYRVGQISDFICSHTGRTNFFVARCLFAIGIIFISVDQIIDLVRAGKIVWMTLFVLALWLNICRREWRRIGRIEREVQRLKDSAVVSLSLINELDSVIWSRKFWFWVSLFYNVLWTSLFGFGMVFLWLSFYALTAFNSGGKSVWQRAKEKIRSLSISWRPTWNPAPTPI